MASLRELVGLKHDAKSVDYEVDVIQPDYSDSVFRKGYGLKLIEEQTISQARDLFCHGGDKIGKDTLLQLALDQYGPMLAKCNSLLTQKLQRYCMRIPRSSIHRLHKDLSLAEPPDLRSYFVYSPDPQNHPTGETLVLTDYAWMHILDSHLSTQIHFDSFEAISAPIRWERGKDMETSKACSVHTMHNSAVDFLKSEFRWWLTVISEAIQNGTESDWNAFLDSIKDQPGVLRHDWSQYHVLAHCDQNTIHGSGTNPGGGICAYVPFR